MISLHVYLTPKQKKVSRLLTAIKDKWLPTMAKQPGFVNAALITPFPDEELNTLGASKPDNTFEAVCFWKSEADRLQWVAKPIHDEVFASVIEASERVSYTLQKVEKSWK